MASVQLTSVFLVLISYVLIVVSSSYPGISAVITKGFLDETSSKTLD